MSEPEESLINLPLLWRLLTGGDPEAEEIVSVRALPDHGTEVTIVFGGEDTKTVVVTKDDILRGILSERFFGKPAEEPGDFLGDAKPAGTGGEACEACQ